MQELFDLRADPQEQNNVIEQYPEVARELEGKLREWVAARLVETGRDQDPLVVQRTCATKIGEEIPGEVIGPGATPLHKRTHGEAANIPAPDALGGKAEVPNETRDDVEATILHGYVEDEESA